MFDVKRHSATLLSLPFSFVIFAFFVVPLCLVIMVSFWDYNSYSIIPDFISNCGMARVFAYLMSNDLQELTDEGIFSDTSETIHNALKDTYAKNPARQ